MSRQRGIAQADRHRRRTQRPITGAGWLGSPHHIFENGYPTHGPGRSGARQSIGRLVIAMRLVSRRHSQSIDATLAAERRKPSPCPFESRIACRKGLRIRPVQEDRRRMLASSQYPHGADRLLPTGRNEMGARSLTVMTVRARAVGKDHDACESTTRGCIRDQGAATKRLVIGMRRQDEPAGRCARAPPKCSCKQRARYHSGSSSPQTSWSSQAIAAWSRA